ncbi:hypothetical protein DPMN_116328 [Dreissena polymorpha]|uniref:Uncharacterized protein n=1 Tax=Dreissena polymorpha TaxID=45954 RepID=A0A9D4KNS5_DREPO|nr:hypothetical protein DPMN_116328 [Dreissena polymorpha]
MMDIVPIMGGLSKYFQNNSVNFSAVKPHITSTCETLRDLLVVEGVLVDKLSKFVRCENDSCLYGRPLSESECKNVCDAIQENVHFDGFSSEKGGDELEDDIEPEVGFCSLSCDIIANSNKTFSS